MKRLIAVVVFLVFALMAAFLVAQQREGGRGGGQRGGPPQLPAAPGPMLEVANKIVDAINKQDAASLQKMAAPGAVYLDEDGHALPVQAWINKLTMETPAKRMMITQDHGQTWDNTGWVSFNYTLSENFRGVPKTLRGTASIVLQKAAGGDWMIQLVHGALEQHVPALP